MLYWSMHNPAVMVSLIHATVTLPQLSDVVPPAKSCAGTPAEHCTVVSAGQANDGASLSTRILPEFVSVVGIGSPLPLTSDRKGELRRNAMLVSALLLPARIRKASIARGESAVVPGCEKV